MATKHANPEDVLSFHASPTNKYMGHFFHFAVDVPVLKTTTTKGGKSKDTYETKMQKLFLSDIDRILARFDSLKGRLDLENTAVPLLSPELLDQLEAAKLDIGATIKWAKAEATAKLEASPKASKAGKVVDKEVGTLVGILSGFAPGLNPDELKEKLLGLVNNAEKMEAAVLDLGEKLRNNKRDDKGYIRLRRSNK